MKKKVFCLIAALFTLVTGIYAQAEEPVTSGTCGDCIWTFDADKNVMTISPVAGGTGRLADFPDVMEAVNQDGDLDYEAQAELLKRPWSAHSQEIKQLIIEDGVTYIGNWSLILIGIEEIVIPPSVTEIGSGAFMGDFFLKKVVIGEGVETIGKMAFFFTRPEEIIVGPNVKNVGEAALGVRESTNVTCLGPAFEQWDEYAEDIDARATIYVLTEDFEGWVSKYPDLADNFRYNSAESEWQSGDCLVKLNTDNTITVSGTGAMADYASTDDLPWKDFCTKVRRVTFENGVTKIGKNAFAECGNLQEVILPEGVTEIGIGAFSTCGSLSSVSLPESVIYIRDYAFGYCERLTQINLSTAVMENGLGVDSFTGCFSLNKNIKDAIMEKNQNAYRLNLQGDDLSNVEYHFKEER